LARRDLRLEDMDTDGDADLEELSDIGEEEEGPRYRRRCGCDGTEGGQDSLDLDTSAYSAVEEDGALTGGIEGAGQEEGSVVSVSVIVEPEQDLEVEDMDMEGSVSQNSSPHGHGHAARTSEDTKLEEVADSEDQHVVRTDASWYDAVVDEAGAVSDLHPLGPFLGRDSEEALLGLVLVTPEGRGTVVTVESEDLGLVHE